MRYATVKSPTDPEWREHSPTFHATNPAKRSVCIDFSIPSGRELLLRLIEGADAVIENFTPRVMDNAGLTYAELSKRRPDIILVRMPGFGVDGPWRDHGGFAQTMEQVSGVGWLTGDPDSEPIIRSTMDPVDRHPRRLCPARRPRTPPPYRAPASSSRSPWSRWPSTSPPSRSSPTAPTARSSNARPTAARLHLKGVYQCAGDDRWVALAVETDGHWEALRRVMDEPGLGRRDPNWPPERAGAVITTG